MPNKQLLFVFLPALLLGMFGLFIQIIRYEPQFAKQTQQEQQSLLPIFAEDPVLGYKQAPITIVAFEDFGCEACRAQMLLMNELLRAYPKKMKVIWKGFSITKFPTPSLLAHSYGFCANEQKKFVVFADEILKATQDLSKETLDALAAKAQLDVKKLSTCLSSGRPEQYQNNMEVLAEALQIQSLPAVFVDNKQIQPPTTLDGWKAILRVY